MIRTTRLDGGALADVLRKQHGVIARRQALACGMTEGTLRHRLRAEGPWRAVIPGIYLAGTGAPSTDQREMAALLHSGAGSVITGVSALLRHGVRVPHSEIVDVLIPASRNRRSIAFVRIQRTIRMPEQACVRGRIYYTLPARAVADTARSLTSLVQVRAVVADAVQRKLCTVRQLSEELHAGQARGSALFRAVLTEVADGVRSVAECDLRDLIRAARLPMPMFNPRLYAGETFVAMPDAWWPDAGVAAEADSREWHLSPHDWERTMARHADMSARGIIVLHFSPRQIREEPGAVASAIRSALDAGRARPRLPIRAVAAA